MNHYKDSIYVQEDSRYCSRLHASAERENYSEPLSYLKQVQLETHQPANGQWEPLFRLVITCINSSWR